MLINGDIFDDALILSFRFGEKLSKLSSYCLLKKVSLSYNIGHIYLNNADVQIYLPSIGYGFLLFISANKEYLLTKNPTAIQNNGGRHHLESHVWLSPLKIYKD